MRSARKMDVTIEAVSEDQFLVSADGGDFTVSISLKELGADTTAMTVMASGLSCDQAADVASQLLVEFNGQILRLFSEPVIEEVAQ